MNNMDKIQRTISEHLDIEIAKIQPTSSIADDLGADSLDQIELIMAFEEELNIEIPDTMAEKLVTVQDVFDFAAKQ